MKDIFFSLVFFIIISLIAHDLNPQKGSIFVRPLTGSSTENSPSTPAAATPSGDGATATRRFRTLEDKPFFSEENSFVDDYYEGHIFSAFQVNISAHDWGTTYRPPFSYKSN